MTNKISNILKGHSIHTLSPTSDPTAAPTAITTSSFNDQHTLSPTIAPLSEQTNDGTDNVTLNTSNQIELHELDNIDDEPVKFYIFWNFSESIKAYFSSCNESSLYGKHIDWKNRFSLLGEKYFSIDNLRKHKWYNPHITINDSDIIIIPLSLSLAANGYCRPNDSDHNQYNFKNNTPFHIILDNIFSELYSLKLGMDKNKNQKVLLMAQEWWTCHIDEYLPSYSIQKFSFHSKLIVGFENIMIRNNKPCFWQKNHGKTPYVLKNRTIVLPFTIPFEYNEYKMYDNLDEYNIDNKLYTLFFMGSVCMSRFENYGDRLLAIKYLYLLNQENTTNTHFGVITDFHDQHKKLYHSKRIKSSCHPSYFKKINLSLESIKICNGSIETLESLPCGLDIKMYNKLNGNNQLYLHGLRNSKFNLMIHGDMPSSGKLWDSMAFNLINIIVGFDKEEIDYFLPFSDIIPYENFLFFINKEKFRENGLNELKNILYNTPQSQIHDMISNLTHYKKYLIWNHPNSSVVDNILKQAKQRQINVGYMY